MCGFPGLGPSSAQPINSPFGPMPPPEAEETNQGVKGEEWGGGWAQVACGGQAETIPARSFIPGWWPCRPVGSPGCLGTAMLPSPSVAAGPRWGELLENEAREPQPSPLASGRQRL